MIYFIAGLVLGAIITFLVSVIMDRNMNMELTDQILFWREQVLFPTKLKIITPPAFKKSMYKKGKKK